MDARFIRHWRRSTGIAAIAWLLIAPAARSAEFPGCEIPDDSGAPLTLAAAVDAALCRNIKTATAWQAVQARTAEVGIARAASLPTVNASLLAQDSTTRTPGTIDATSRMRGLGGSVGVNWRLFDFGERAANQSSADSQLAAAVASRDDAVRKTVDETIQAYFAALQARATLEARQQAARQAARTLAAAERREERGIAGRSDTLQAETALARARLARQRAQSDVDKSFSSLGYVIGAAVGTPLTLPPRPQSVDDTPLPELAALLDDARLNHPAILAARAQRDADNRKVSATLSQGRPTVDFSLSHQRNGSSNQVPAAGRSSTLSAGFTVNIPIFDGYSNKYQVQRARAQAQTSEAQVVDVEQQVLSELVTAVSDVRSSRASLDASKQLLDTANAALESADNRYQRGVGDILELINAQNALSDALESQAQCESLWHAARLKLLADIGQWRGSTDLASVKTDAFPSR
ncbi:TolC family protein [Mitsuaria sp. CC2]|jgi:outer membrane protein|uniref:TolC family protein n=1 Tax=Mitsuaria sp. CC2 TaxID=3029186 RepID=UPI003B8E052C